MKIDLLFIAAHPDDVELCCAGTVFSHIAQGYTVGIVDLTAGELGTRGTAAIRAEEAANASSIMGISFRENRLLILGGPDRAGVFSLPIDGLHAVACLQSVPLFPIDAPGPGVTCSPL